MGQINFVKYNKTRRAEFQIKTTILEENNTRYVEKTALKEEAYPHIWSFASKYEQLSIQHPGIIWLKPEIDKEKRTARFEYIEGKTLAEQLGDVITDGKVPIREVKEVLNLLYVVPNDYVIDFKVTPEFVKVFGECGELQDWSLKTTNIDALFENYLVKDEKIYAIDYEWVFDFPIPVHFVKYRILKYFFEQYSSLMEKASFEKYLSDFLIDHQKIDLYEQMESHFQVYVHGENQQNQLGKYWVQKKSITEFPKIDQRLTEIEEKYEQQTYEIREKDTTISKIQEVQRLTNNHVTNLEIIITNLRREVDEQAKIIEYLNRHEAAIYKVRRKLSQKFNQVYPKGTTKRKKLGYLKEFVFHPIRSSQRYGSVEGRNLIDGDFKIGEIYRTYGKLAFPVFEQPLVSVIIPVYNQVHYTYACLQSILEFTKDLPYEIIIADDVSTDATAELERYVENVVICRNEQNQGFLKNCNQAAKSAKGSYIMFLNNDTKVTENWLQSLVDLIASDETIGMVGSKLVYPDGRLQEAGGIIWSDGSGWNYGRLDNPEKPEYNYVKEVDYISGAAILLSKNLWEQIGGFDTRYAPAYCEDSDLAFEVRKAGYRVVYQPKSVVIHFEGVSNGTDVAGEGLKRYQVENSIKLKEKWAQELKNQCENNGNPDPFRARERSAKKPMVLVVDHYVPTYDRDAGSKTTFQYLKLFLQKGFAVKFLGDNFLCEEPYSSVLQQMGIEILYGKEYQAGIWGWLKAHGDDIEYVYLNRPHIATKYIDFIKKNTNMKIIYYGHDLHFLREGREYTLTGNLEKFEAAQYWKSVELSLMKKADISYYPSYVERDAILELDESIAVKDIVAYVYDQFLDNIPQDFDQREGILFVGGFAHPPNEDAVLWFANEVFPIIRSVTEMPFYVVGSKVTEAIKALEQPDSGIIIKGFVSDEELAELYRSCKVVIVPLRYGAGVKGKVIEALYYGAPIVTTSIGAEGITDTEGILRISDEPEEFAKQVIELYQDSKQCQLLSEQTQQYIRTRFSVEAAWNIIGEDFGG